MRIQHYIIFFGAVVCAISVTSVSAGGKGKGGKHKKCGDGELKMEEMMKGRKECFKTKEGGGGGGGEERRKRSPKKGKNGGKGGKMNLCAKVCMWKIQGVLDDKGAFSESGVTDFIKKVYPEAKASGMTDKAKECAKEHGSKFSMDDNCAGYLDFKKCFMKAHFEVCEIKRGGKGKGGEKATEEA